MSTAVSWAADQRRRYALRRWFMRDVLLRQIGFRALVVPHVTGLENIPTHGPTIFMINHTISIDGLLVMGLVTSRYVIPLLKIENLQDPLIGFLARNWGSLGIHRGEIDREALKTVLALLEMGEAILIAPEGTRQAQLSQPKDGLAYLATKANATIVPVGISNGESWAYDLKRPWRRTHIQVHFGPPFRLKNSGKKASREQLQQITTEMMYQLARLLPESYRGEYADLNQMTMETLELSR